MSGDGTDAEMRALEAQFLALRAGLADLERLLGPQVPSATRVRLRALELQITSGDVTGHRPGDADEAAQAQWDAWAALAGTSHREALLAFFDTLRTALATAGDERPAERRRWRWRGN